VSIRIQEQVLFEIAMSLGTSLDFEDMLNVALSTYLRRLCCMGAVVFLEEEGVYKERFSIPRKDDDKTVCNIYLEKINGCSDKNERQKMVDEMPLHSSHNGKHYYLMPLSQVGFLMVVKGQAPLSQSMLKSLQKINIKLAESILSCITHSKNEILNMKLKNQIRGRKKAEASLLAERKKYMAIFENSPVGMVYYDEEGVIRECNQKFIDIMGSSREKLIGFNTVQSGSATVREVIGKALNGEFSTYEGEYTSITGNRHTYLRTRFNPVTSDSGKTEVIATVEEIERD